VSRRALKLGFGIALLIVGLFTTIAGVALTALVGADGRFELPETTARSRGYALVFDAIYIRGNLATSGSLSATLGIEVRGREGQEIFVGIGPPAEVRDYLGEAAYDRVVRIDWPGGAGTQAIDGAGEPGGPPGDQDWWEASDRGETASLDWTVRDGDWVVVVMNADASRDVDIAGSVAVDLPILGPISIGALLTGLAILIAGVLLTISGAKTAPPERLAAAVPAGPTTPGAALPGAPPPRPDG
jgi:hypothetical protein